MNYEYRTIRIQRGAWPDVADAVPGAYGVWRGEIGWYTDEGAIMTAGGVTASDIPGVIESSTETIVPTVRPVENTPPTEDGIYAHRWFELFESDWTEFLDLSQSAWPAFEGTFEGVHVIGLWRALEAPDGWVRALLLTRYPSLASWETSRPYSPEKVPGAEEARRRFMRRAEITQRTVVRITRLVR